MNIKDPYIGDGGEAPSDRPPTPSPLPPSLKTNKQITERFSEKELSGEAFVDSVHPIRLQILFDGKPLISTAVKSIPDSPNKIAKLLREMADIFDAPEEEDPEFF